MANAARACSPFAPPRFQERAQTIDEYFGMAVSYANEEGLFIDPRNGFKGEFSARAWRDLGKILPMDLKQYEGWMVQRGYLKLIDDASEKSGKTFVPNKDMNAVETGYAAAISKVYLESMAGGAKQLADNFLMKVAANEDATQEGLLFAQQMKTLSRFGATVMGWDQQLGRGLQQSAFIRGPMSRGAESLSTEVAKDALGNPGQFSDKFAEIATKLNDPQQASEGIGELIRLAKRVQFLDDPQYVGKAGTALQVAGNAWTESFMNGLLSGPQTVITNAIGGVWAVARPMLQLGAAKAFEAVAPSGSVGGKAAQMAAAEASATLMEMYTSAADALQIGWQAAKTERSLYQNLSTPAISGEAFKGAMEGLGMEVANPGIYDALTQVGKVVRLPSRAQLSFDEMYKHLATRGQVAARGVRRAALEGVDLTDKAAVQEYITKELNDAFYLTPDVLGKSNAEQVDKYKAYLYRYNQKEGPVDAAGLGFGSQSMSPAQVANEVTFQEDNAFADSANKIISKVPGLRPFFPFIRTPLNILKQGVFQSTGVEALMKGAGIAIKGGLDGAVDSPSLFSPAAAIYAVQQELLKDPAETARLAGQIGLTTLIASQIYTQAMNGAITGGGPGRWTAGRDGKAAQDAWLAAGNVPYSVKIGDQAIPFDRFGEPLAIFMRMVADLGMYSAYMEGSEQDEVIASMVGIGVSGLYQASFLTGVESLVKVGQGDTDYALGNAVQNYVATQTPFGGLLAYVDRVQDPYKSVYQSTSFAQMLKVTEDAFGTGIFGKVASRIPGLGQSPQLVDQLTGKPVPIVPGVGPGGMNPLQMAVPVFPRNSSADSVWQAVWDIKGSYIERRPSELKLTPAEQQKLNSLMANSVIGGRTLSQRILALRSRSDVQAFVDNRGGTMQGAKFQIEKELDAILTEHFQAAKTQLYSSSPDLLKRLRVKDARDKSLKSNDPLSAQVLGDELDGLLERARRGY